ncbi:MAG: relaxase/mobilization nuclease domain-containing protein [Spirochaetes bacterium]|uniref:Relaxase/mobilization nuclease domain-containing protein n=1 Tax=Candidatus Gallitreponema excrementavium TaxID=2840840 RepID=A0A9D9HNB6_9SPIR|nr:relaxase/mobilization nuclease domain-containing protein [Candidatus Gallitreponema excrementavium]
MPYSYDNTERKIMRRRLIKESPFFANSTAHDGNGWDNKMPVFKINRGNTLMVMEMRKLWRILNYLLYSSPAGKNKEKEIKAIESIKTISRKQNCVVKMKYGTEIKNHLRFLKEYLPQEKKEQVKEKPELFDNSDKPDIEKYKKEMVGRHYKFIISPENPEMDCKALAKTLVARLEVLTGHKFVWLAAVHTDTGHPHAHLLINGVDARGKKVECFRGTLLKHTIREMAKQICTEIKGERTIEEIRASISKLPEANRYCTLDKAISLYSYVSKNNENKNYETCVRSQNEIMYKRLCHLEKIGLAVKRKNNNIFDLEKNWEEKLRSLGRYSSYLKARNDLLFTSNVELKVFKGENGESAKGIITKIYKMNYEESWDNAIVVENKAENKSWFIPVHKEPNSRLLGAEVNCYKRDNGKFNTVIHVTKWNSLEK